MKFTLFIQVYMAERVNAGGKAWHKQCFRCNECKKSLGAKRSERDGKIFCERKLALQFPN